jgi:cell shape-determining protein MreC
LEHLLGEREAASPGILAGVVLRPPVSPYDTLVIDAGFKDGVVVGALVEGPGGAPIGTIGSVATDSARVILYSSYGVSTSAWAGEERTPLTLMGEGGGAFSATASSEAPLTVGEAISLPVGGAGVMGVIDRIDKDPSSPEAEVRIRPLVNPYSITWVTVSHSAPTAP